MNNQAFNPNLIPEDEIAEIEKQREAQLKAMEERANPTPNTQNTSSSEEVVKESKKEEGEGSSSSSLDSLGFDALNDDAVRAYAIKFLLGEFIGVQNSITDIDKTLSSIKKSLPEIPKVINNYCEFKKNEVTKELEDLENRAATVSSVLTKTASKTISLINVDLNKVVNEGIEKLDLSVNENLEKFNSQVNKNTSTIKSYLNKNTIFVLISIFFFQLLIFGVFTIFTK